MADYNYTISTDFPNQAVAGDKLRDEIVGSSISSAPLELVNTDEDSDECKIKFDGSLSVADQTTLDGLVAVHDGVSYVDLSSSEGLWVFSQAESSTTSPSWQNKCTLNMGNVPSGTYRIRWSFEWEVVDNDNEGGGFRVRLDDSTLIWQMDTFPIKKLHPTTESLIWYENIPAGTHHLDLEYYSNNGREIKIRNAALDVRRV